LPPATAPQKPLPPATVAAPAASDTAVAPATAAPAAAAPAAAAPAAAAAVLIWALAQQSEAAQQRLIDVGAAQALTRALQEHAGSASVVRHAARALTALASDSRDAPTTHLGAHHTRDDWWLAVERSRRTELRKTALIVQASVVPVLLDILVRYAEPEPPSAGAALGAAQSAAIALYHLLPDPRA
jgi:hypothetical protein